MEIHVDSHIEVRVCGLSATWNSNLVPIAHLGCKTLDKLLSGYKGDVRRDLGKKLDGRFAKGWRDNSAATPRVADALACGIAQANTALGGGHVLQGAVLWDTMRKGSDYWRPGNLLTDVADAVRENHRWEVAFQREDQLCPPSSLLEGFSKDPAFRFGAYAQEYSDYLQGAGSLDIAIAGVVANLACGRLPVFYCVDPYVPGYGDPTQVLSHVRYDRRNWAAEPELRDVGCHRVVLVEEIARRLLKCGARVQILALDPTFQTCHAEIFPAKPPPNPD